MLQALRLDLEIAVGAEFGDDAVELRRGVAVELGVEVGVGEDQVFGDVAEFDIVGEQRQVGLALCGRMHRSEPRNSVRARNRPRSSAMFGSCLPSISAVRRMMCGVRYSMTISACARVEMVDLRHRPRSRAAWRVSAWYSKKERFSGSGQLSPTSRT